MLNRYQQGVRPALELIAEEGGGRGGTVLRYVFALLDKISRTKTPIPSYISSVFSPIRLVAWHPHILALAVVAWDDSIRLFSSQASLCCILKTKMQRSVNCLAWRYAYQLFFKEKK
jgi:WD40 repeat protein